MTPGALMTGDVECAVESVLKKPAQANGSWFDVPVLSSKANSQDSSHDIHQLEALLLAWALLLYRNSNGGPVQFSWSLSELGAATTTTFEVNTSTLGWTATDSVKVALDSIREYLRQQLDSEYPLAADRYTFSFNDEFAPDGSFSHLKDGDHTMSWVRCFAKLRHWDERE